MRVVKDRGRGSTPAIVALEAAGVPFTVHEFHHEPGERNYGIVAAEALGVEPERVFKTLVAQLAVHGPVEHAVGIVPVSGASATTADESRFRRAAMRETIGRQA